MKPVQILSKKKWNLAAIFVSVMLVGLISFLVNKNYLSQVELQKYTLEQLRQDIVKRAIAVSYFYAERKNDLMNLTEFRAISAYFENKALGMSMEYGLKASLIAIYESFNRLLEVKRLGKDRIYTRIILIGGDGELLVDTQSTNVKEKHMQDWKKFLSPESSDVAILYEHTDKILKVMVSIPYFFKNKYVGQIIAWVRPEIVFKHLVKVENGASRRIVYVEYEKGHLHIPADIKLKPPFTGSSDLRNIETEKPHRFKLLNANGTEVEIYAIRVPIRDTPFSLITLLPASEVSGQTPPSHMLIGMGAVSLAILGGMAIILIINARNLVLNTRLEESTKREREIEEKNLQLQKEINDRMWAEEALRRARNQLEIRVQVRTEELANANEALRDEVNERKQAEEALRKSEEAAKRLAEENAIMAEIGRILSSTLNIEEVYERFAEAVREIIPFDRIAINTIDPKNNTYTVAYTTGLEVIDAKKGDTLPLPGSANEEVIRTRSSLLIQTERMDDFKHSLPGLIITFQAGLRSMMSVPLFSKDKVIGVLHLRSTKPNAYTDRDLRLAERVGNQIAGAIANAQLFIEQVRTEEERAALEEQLFQSQKMEAIGQLAGGIAHDFNNHLTIIKGYTQLSLMELEEDNSLKENLKEVQKATEKAANLTQQILAFSRRQLMEMRVLNLNTLLKDLNKMLHRFIGEDIELVTKLAEDLGTIKADPGKIEQAIINLAINARDAMPKGGKLTIETANVQLDEAYALKHVNVKPGHYIMVSVSDTGLGMAPDVRERIFDPFFTTKEKGKGTGLGLSTVYGIVTQSGGNILVYSDVGQGTTFKIYLPRVDEPLVEIKRRVEVEGLPRGGETVLITEDEEVVRKLIVQILNKQGYTVLEASHGNEALQICKTYEAPIHLLVTDVVMPGMSGAELFRNLTSLRPDMKVLYLSGYTDNAIAHHGVLDEGISFIQKPFTMDGLARKVREVLDK